MENEIATNENIEAVKIEVPQVDSNKRSIELTREQILRLNMILFREKNKLIFVLEEADKEDRESDWGIELSEQVREIDEIQEKLKAY